MKFDTFFSEAKRVEKVTADQRADSPEKQAWRKPGDVGPVDRLTQIDKKPGVDYSKRGQYIKRVDKERDPVDKLISSMGDEEPDMDPKYDPDSPQYQRRSRSGKEIQQSMTKAYRPGMDAITSADRVMRDKTFDAEAPTVAQPLQVKGLKGGVAGTPYLRSGYQSSGVGLNKKIGQDDLDYIYAAIADETPQQKKKSPTGTIDSKGIEDTKQRRPTARDNEALNPEAEKQAAQTKAYMTPEVMRQQKLVRDATEKQDAKALQKAVFKHKVSDDMVQAFIDMYGYNNRKNSILLKRMEGFGATAPLTAKYGGDLGPDAKHAEVSPGVYNYNKLTATQKEQALNNRTRSMIRTYLQQGGRDAYAGHEGIRSISDMDLEHIASLKGDKAGRDHPDNWVFASTELNRLRGERDLTGEGSPTEKAAQGERKLPDDFDTIQQQTFRQFTQDDSELATALADTFGGDPTAKGAKRGIFALGKYRNMSEPEREELRAKARAEGMPESAVQKIFPSPEPQADTQLMGDSEFQGEVGSRYGGQPYMTDPEQYDADTTQEARDRIMKREVIKQIGDKYGSISKAERDKTPEYQDFLRQIKASQGAVQPETDDFE